MVSLCDLPPFVIDQVIGTRDTSYVVIKLWLCGNRQLHSKLSAGLTVLELYGNPFESFCFPKLIQHLRSLRTFVISGIGSLIRTGESPTSLVESLPPTLTKLHLHASDGWQKLIWNHGVVTQYPRGPSQTIDLEALFPHLHTLVLSSSDTAVFHNAVSVFPALPSSLTSLTMPIFISSSDTILMSALPPALRHLPGKLRWRLQIGATSVENALDAIRRNFASAPPSLETMKVDARMKLPWATKKQIETSTYEYLLPNSLTAATDWNRLHGPFWCPSLARTMPPNIKILLLGNIDLDSFRNTHTNWIADLPRSLTKLQISRTDAAPIDFTSHVRFLPRSLTELYLTAIVGLVQKGRFGDWSIISAEDWPPNLRSLQLFKFWVDVLEMNFPDTVESLNIEISTKSKDQPLLDTAKLPLNLTNLSLGWTHKVHFYPSLARLPLKSCLLSFSSLHYAHPTMPEKWLSELPSSLERLVLERIGLPLPVAKQKKTNIAALPKLHRLEVYRADFRWFEHFSRSLRKLSITILDTDSDLSRITRDGQLFKHLPPGLVELHLLHGTKQLPPQKLGHLKSLTFLDYRCTPNVPSKQMQHLPASLKVFYSSIVNLDLEDLSFLPQGLNNLQPFDDESGECYLTKEYISRVPFSTLARMDRESLDNEDEEDLEPYAAERVLYASKNP